MAEQNTELRKLLKELDKLKNIFGRSCDEIILETLMGNIKKNLNDPNSEPRFTASDRDLVMLQSRHRNVPATSLFLDEWITMGSIRPTLRNLYDITLRCQLFRAAEYIASVMGIENPTRPNAGPARRVDISLPNDSTIADNSSDPPSAPSEHEAREGNTILENRDNQTPKPSLNDKQINLTRSTNQTTVNGTANEPPPAIEENFLPAFSQFNVTFENRVSNADVKSNMIGFSKEEPKAGPSGINNKVTPASLSSLLPDFSELQQPLVEVRNSLADIPDFSGLGISENDQVQNSMNDSINVVDNDDDDDSGDSDEG